MATLETSLVAEKLSEELESQFKDFHPGNNIEDDRTSFRDTVYAASLKLLGPSTWKQQDWFDEDINALLT